MNDDCPENAAEAARHIKGTTFAWGAGRVFDVTNPDSTPITIEDYAYALAYTVRWRGQARYPSGRRAFYGVAQHCVVGAEEMLLAGMEPVHALAFLMHESDEAPFGDTPGPLKQLWSDDYRAMVKNCGDSINRSFGIEFPDPALIKRWDIRMLVTEKRDLLPGFEADTFSIEDGVVADDRFAPFKRRIVPMPHPDRAAEAFLALYHSLKEEL